MDAARIAELLRPFLDTDAGVPAWPVGTSVPEQSASLAQSLSPRHPDPERSEGEESAFLSPSQLQNISTYINLLLRWNTRINLTAIRHPEEIVPRHFGESLFAARYLFSASVGPGLRSGRAGRSSAEEPGAPSSSRFVRQGGDLPDLIDFGSGAGFPGLPIKIWAPGLRVTLIESSQKKATFLREVVRTLTLTNVNVFSARAQDFPHQAAVVTLRAVERFAAALPVAARLVRPGGHLALLVGESQADRARQLLPSFEWSAPVPIPLSSSRIMLTAHEPI